MLAEDWFTSGFVFSQIFKGTIDVTSSTLFDVKLQKVDDLFQVCLNLYQRRCDNIWFVLAHYLKKVDHV